MFGKLSSLGRENMSLYIRLRTKDIVLDHDSQFNQKEQEKKKESCENKSTMKL